MRDEVMPFWRLLRVRVLDCLEAVDDLTERNVLGDHRPGFVILQQ